MNSYPVQASSLISQDPQTQAQDSALSRPAENSNTPHVSALPQDTVTLSQAARGEQGALATNATPNKPAPPPAHSNFAANSPQKG